MNLRSLLDENRTAILETARRHGARNVRIFGSVARGEEDDKSDLDFLVEMEPGQKPPRPRRALARLGEASWMQGRCAERKRD